MYNCYFWFQVTVNDRLALRGPLLLPFLAGFTALSELDLSLDKSTIGGSSGSLLFIDDKILQQFFACFSSHFKNLQSLRINFWRITLEDSEKTMRQIAKYLKLCNLSFLKANGLIVTDSAKKVQMEHVFVQTILTHLQYLTWLCLDGVDLTESQASSIGKCVRDRFPGTSLEISAKDVHVKSVKALVAAIEEGGRAEVVYTGGSNCRLKITKVQKSGKGKKKWRTRLQNSWLSTTIGIFVIVRSRKKCGRRKIIGLEIWSVDEWKYKDGRRSKWGGDDWLHVIQG